MTFQPASLIGLALVFFVSSWLASALVALAWRSLAARVSGLGPQGERTAAEVGLVLPVVVGAALVLPLVAHATASRGRRDHCLRSGDGLHFCFQHGAGWVQSLAALALLGGMLAPLVRRAIAGAAAARAARRDLATLRALSSALPGEVGVRLVRGHQRFCFVVGRRRATIYVSEAAWKALAPDERSAVLAHERAHIAQGDLARRALLAVLASLGAPLLGRRLLAAWQGATERLCDLRAAAACADPAAVASAMLVLAGSVRAAPGAAFVETPEDVEHRVRSVLAGGATGEDAAQALWQDSVRVTVGLLLTSLVLYDQIHAALERCLTWLR